MKPGDRLWSRSFRDLVQVVEVSEMFGVASVRVWHPASDRIAVVPASDIELREIPDSVDALVASAAAARVADALAGGALLAPTQSIVDPLPHQLRALSRCITPDATRMLLADEVGLGKTIEAGLVISELMLRGLVRRVLVIAPKGLVAQWQGELLHRFGETYVALSSSEVAALAGRREDNFWLAYERIIVPLDAVKPIEGRRGWSPDRVERYNIARSTNLAAAGWDLVVIDEAHRVAGYGEQVARNKLARLLADAVPNILLLTATPHVGKSDGFRRVLSLLDEKAFVGSAPITPARVQPYVVRTSKRVAIDGDGRPLFKARSTLKVVLDWPADRPRQRQLYNEVTVYAREGYDLGRREKNNSLVFLMLLMQRIVSSSSRAIQKALERRLESLKVMEERLLALAGPTQLRLDEEFWEADANEQLELLLASHLPAMRNEMRTVERLILLASDAQQEGLDIKLERLYQLLVDVAREENDPLVKVLVFTEFLSTQAVITEFLESMGVTVAVLNGDMVVAEREQVQELFAGAARVLVSTEAGGEGLNLQVAHLVVNFDLPWNPMRIEQRIGRVDRIGQKHAVRAFNLVLRDSVEDRVHDLLEVKLSRILAEFGVDKLSDVLDSGGFDGAFQTAYGDVLLGQDAEVVTARVADEVRAAGAYLRDWRDLLGGEMPDPADARAMRDHPLPQWIERMTVAGARAQGGRAQRQQERWALEWPDGRSGLVTFRREHAGTSASLLTLADEHVAATLKAHTVRVAGGPMVQVAIKDLSAGVEGVWSLWLIIAHAGRSEKVRALPIFHDASGDERGPSARAIWDRMLEADAVIEMRGTVAPEVATSWAIRARQEAERQGGAIYGDLRESLARRLRRRRETFLEYIERRRAIVERVGLENVRRRRLAELEREREQELRAMPEVEIAPELRCLAIVQVVR